MRMWSFLVAGVFFAVGVEAQSVTGQPAVPVLEKDTVLKSELRALVRYPMEVRQAIPVVCQHPKLAGDLYEALQAKNAESEISDILSKFPQDVKDAGRRLTKTPEVLEILVINPELAKAIGDIYKRFGMEKLREMVQKKLKEDAETEASVVAWSKRLGRNRTALQQFSTAMMGYVQDESPPQEEVDYGMGVRFLPTKVTVYDLPPAPFVAYVLVNADGYPELADEMLEQWLRTKSDDDFDDAVGLWWAVNRQQFKTELLSPDGRAERLTEIAKLGKKLGEELKDKHPTMEDRVKFLEDHATDYPKLVGFTQSGKDLPPPPKPGENIARPSVPMKAPTQPPVQPVAPVASPSVLKGAPKLADTLTQEKPTEEQLTRRATQGNYFNYYQASAPTVTPPAYYGYPYYNAYPAYYGMRAGYLNHWNGGFGRPGGVGGVGGFRGPSFNRGMGGGRRR